jgi:hypothetical protein
MDSDYVLLGALRLKDWQLLMGRIDRRSTTACCAFCWQGRTEFGGKTILRLRIFRSSSCNWMHTFPRREICSDSRTLLETRGLSGLSGSGPDGTTSAIRLMLRKPINTMDFIAYVLTAKVSPRNSMRATRLPAAPAARRGLMPYRPSTLGKTTPGFPQFRIQCCRRTGS